ncbi:MAG TPA: YceI family protein [Candidatus Limnocylindrales bacterium]|nr:YceI family protein [Candidatus Limnocylindrales bacterium]
MRLRLAALISGVTLLGAVGLAFVYFVLIGGSSPARLTLSSAGSTTSASASTGTAASASPAATQATTGVWTVATGSQAGYRVREQLGFAPALTDAVGRTAAIQGSVTIVRTSSSYQVSAGAFTVNVSTLTSDRAMRDQRIHTMGLESDRYPNATFTLSSPVALPSQAAGGQTVTVSAVGNLTIHGVTRSVTIPMQARLSGSQIAVAGSIAFPFADFGMTPPSIANFVSVQPNVTMEFSLVFAHA